MKSKVLKLIDYKTIPLTSPVRITGMKEEIDVRLHQLLKPYRKREAAAVVQKGDNVLLSLKSEWPKMNRDRLPVSVGSGLFDKELEAFLPGKQKNQPYMWQAPSGETVTVLILEINHLTYPALSDALLAEIEKQHPDNAAPKTAAAYMERLHQDVLKERKEAAVHQEALRIFEQIVKGSQWAIDEGEADDLVQNYLASATEQLRQANLSWETMRPSDYQNYFGEIRSKEALEEYLQREVRTALMRTLLFCALTGTDASQLSADELSDAAGERLEAYVREQAVFEIED